MKSLGVFCGSSTGGDPVYAHAARRLGRLLAESGVTLVFGGGRVGLMGAVADAAREAGGEAVGVMPRALIDREIGHEGLSELHVVGSMHERKAMMADLSDGFVALPGGAGTLEEFFEVFTWALLGEHRKPCGLLNTAGYHDPLLALFDHMVERGFLTADQRSLLLVEDDPASLLERFDRYRPPETVKWGVQPGA